MLKEWHRTEQVHSNNPEQYFDPENCVEDPELSRMHYHKLSVVHKCQQGHHPILHCKIDVAK